MNFLLCELDITTSDNNRDAVELAKLPSRLLQALNCQEQGLLQSWHRVLVVIKFVKSVMPRLPTPELRCVLLHDSFACVSLLMPHRSLSSGWWKKRPLKPGVEGFNEAADVIALICEGLQWLRADSHQIIDWNFQQDLLEAVDSAALLFLELSYHTGVGGLATLLDAFERRYEVDVLWDHFAFWESNLHWHRAKCKSKMCMLVLARVGFRRSWRRVADFCFGFCQGLSH